MKLPAKIIYACKALLELALHYEEGKPVQLSKVCVVGKMPEKFVIQLFLRLKNAGIVNTSRGVRGGYSLARHPSQVTLADIFRAIDQAYLDFAAQRDRRDVSEGGNILDGIWKDAGEALVSQLENITLEQLVLRRKNNQFSYSI